METLKEKLNRLVGENLGNLTSEDVVKASEEVDIIILKEMEEMNYARKHN